MPTRPLKVGLLIDTPLVPLWAYRALELSMSRGDMILTSLVVKVGTDGGGAAGFPRRFSLSKSAWYLFARIDQWLSRRIPSRIPDPRSSMDIRALLAPGAKIIEVSPRTGQYSDWILPADVDSIAAMDLDVLFRIGFRIVRGEVLSRGARYGVWSFHHGNNRTYRGQPSCFWEFLHKEKYVGAVLQVMSEELDGGILLGKANIPAGGALTWSSILNRMYWHASELLPKCLHILAIQGKHGFDSMVTENQVPLYVHDRPLFVHPGRVDSIRAMGRILEGCFRILAKRLAVRPMAKFKLINISKWGIMFDRDARAYPGSFILNLRRFRLLRPPRGHFWADPFLVEREGKTYLFFEDFSTSTGKGVIQWAEMGKEGLRGTPATALEEACHLSYPFIFLHEGQYYMVPECRSTGQIRLYRCLSFPDQWEFHSVMVDAMFAADTTLFEHEGRWWLFTAGSTNPIAGDHGLFVFHADSPFGPWSPHLRNPVTLDAQNLRPAGMIQRRAGLLIRPGQSAAEYGWGIQLMEIQELNETEYRERLLEVIEPKWAKGVHGVHTLNICNKYTVIDCKLVPEWIN